MEVSSKFFSNTACEYFPCHKGVPIDEFNCLLCYCPLYALGPNCDGTYTFTESGLKDCSNCAIPHCGEKGIAWIEAHYQSLVDLAAR